MERTFVSGDLEHARREAAAALDAAAGQPVWESTYRVELARVYLYQGRNQDALSMLTTPVGEGVPSKVRVRWHTVRSLALDRTEDDAGAEQELAEAERISASGPVSLQGEVASSYGSLRLDQGKPDDAADRFREALEKARAGNDRFLETQSLVNLGVLAVQEEHSEEALYRFGEAREVAVSIGARLQLEKIMGSAGFALYNLGDFVAAQQQFEQAERQAKELGAPKDRIRWLTNEGMSAARLGDNDRALLAYQDGLHEAGSIGSEEAISDCHASLALLLLDTDPQKAAVHIREAARISAKRRYRPDEQNAELLEGMLLSRTGQLEQGSKRLQALDKDTTMVPSLRWQAEQELARVSLRMGDERTAERWFRRAIETFHRQRLTLQDVESTLPFLENGTDLYSDYVQFLVDRGRTDEALTVVDQSRAEALMRGGPDAAVGHDLGHLGPEIGQAVGRGAGEVAQP